MRSSKRKTKKRRSEFLTAGETLAGETLAGNSRKRQKNLSGVDLLVEAARRVKEDEPTNLELGFSPQQLSKKGRPVTEACIQWKELGWVLCIRLASLHKTTLPFVATNRDVEVSVLKVKDKNQYRYVNSRTGKAKPKEIKVGQKIHGSHRGFLKVEYDPKRNSTKIVKGYSGIYYHAKGLRLTNRSTLFYKDKDGRKIKIPITVKQGGDDILLEEPVMLNAFILQQSPRPKKAVPQAASPARKATPASPAPKVTPAPSTWRTNGGWSDMGTRQKMMPHIQTRVEEKRPPNAGETWVFIMVKRFEKLLYDRASSEAEYKDLRTLDGRLNEIAKAHAKQRVVEEKRPVSQPFGDDDIPVLKKKMFKILAKNTPHVKWQKVCNVQTIACIDLIELIEEMIDPNLLPRESDRRFLANMCTFTAWLGTPSLEEFKKYSKVEYNTELIKYLCDMHEKELKNGTITPPCLTAICPKCEKRLLVPVVKGVEKITCSCGQKITVMRNVPRPATPTQLSRR